MFILTLLVRLYCLNLYISIVFKRGTVADASCLAWGFMVRGRCLIVCSVVANDPVRGRAFMYCIYIVYVVW